MTHGMERSRSEGCLSDLKLDRWVAGELSETAVAEAQTHVDGCAACAERKRIFSEAQQDFAETAPALVAPKAKRTPWLWAGPVTGLAVAAAAALWFQPTETVRSKGGFDLGFYVQSGDSVRQGETGEKLLPGDQVRFEYTSETPVHLTILSTDGAGVISTYYPVSDSTELAAGVQVSLPGAIQLDATLGVETVVGIACAEPVSIEVLKEQVRSGDRLFPEGCASTEIQWTKVTP